MKICEGLTDRKIKHGEGTELIEARDRKIGKRSKREKRLENVLEALEMGNEAMGNNKAELEK